MEDRRFFAIADLQGEPTIIAEMSLCDPGCRARAFARQFANAMVSLVEAVQGRNSRFELKALAASAIERGADQWPNESAFLTGSGQVVATLGGRIVWTMQTDRRRESRGWSIGSFRAIHASRKSPEVY